MRQLARKDRQLEELREELQKEKIKTAKAEQAAHIAAQSEEKLRQEAGEARWVASQKEVEYEAIVSCRKLDHDRYQAGLDDVKEKFNIHLQDRLADLESYRKLEIIAEQQKQTIGQLQELTRRLDANFKAYREEIDRAITGMREHVDARDAKMASKLEEMTTVTGQMRWVMKIERHINQAKSP